VNLENKYILTLISFFLTLAICLIFSYIFIQNSRGSYILNPTILEVSKSSVTIYLGEGFLKTGFYEVPSSFTVKDILERYDNNIDPNEHKLDLNQGVTDGLKLEFKANNNRSQTTNTPAKKDINLANESDLDSISGIGQVTAAAIVDYVKSNGPITNLNDLDNVKGVGSKTIEEIKKYYK